MFNIFKAPQAKVPALPRLSTFNAPGLGWFTLPRYVARNMSPEQIVAAGLLVLQSGE